MSMSSEREEKLKLLQLVEGLLQKDNELRQQYGIGDKFRFVRERLQALVDQLEKHTQVSDEQGHRVARQPTAEEKLMFVYLYNTQGNVIQTWANMLTPKLFYEYSINRPIYADKMHVDILIRSKANKLHHAVLSIAVKASDLIPNENPVKDNFGNPIIKIREGSLQFDRFISFYHNDNEYDLSDAGILIKK